MFRARLKHKNKFIDGYFIDLNGNIYDDKFVKQETYINDGYQKFKNLHIHVMMAHSFYGYKKGYDIHHLNQIKTDNSLDNLLYLTHAQHTRLHNLGKTFSEETKQKMRENRTDKKKIICLESGIVYPSINVASKELKINLGHLSCHLNKKRYKSVGGLHFQFVL